MGALHFFLPGFLRGVNGLRGLVPCPILLHVVVPLSRCGHNAGWSGLLVVLLYVVTGMESVFH